jgi:multidrug transporter EmrE-like cation transporter
MGPMLLALAVIFNVAANSMFKYAGGIQDMAARKLMILGIGLLVGLANTLCFIKALEKIELSVAYPVFSAASIILIGILSPPLFGEHLSIQKSIGLAVICIGLLLTWGS